MLLQRGEVGDEDWQLQRFREHFDPSIQQVICYGDEDVGFLEVLFQTDEIFLQNIEIIPAFQGCGIGSELLGLLLAKALKAKIPLKLQVLKVKFPCT